MAARFARDNTVQPSSHLERWSLQAEKLCCKEEAGLLKLAKRRKREPIPELEKRCRSYLKATTDSWRVDETYVKVKKVWQHLYRAVASQGNTLEFFLSPKRDAQAAKRFFAKALNACHTVTPRVSTVDKHCALFGSSVGESGERETGKIMLGAF